MSARPFVNANRTTRALRRTRTRPLEALPVTGASAWGSPSAGERWSHDRGSVSASVPAASLRVSATLSAIWSCVPTVICDGATRR